MASSMLSENPVKT